MKLRGSLLLLVCVLACTGEAREWSTSAPYGDDVDLPSWLTPSQSSEIRNMARSHASPTEIRDKVVDYFMKLPSPTRLKHMETYYRCTNNHLVELCNDPAIKGTFLLTRKLSDGQLESQIKAGIRCERRLREENPRKLPFFDGECEIAWELERNAIEPLPSTSMYGRSTTAGYPDWRATDRYSNSKSTDRYGDRTTTPGYPDWRVTDRYSNSRSTDRYGDRTTTPGYPDFRSTGHFGGRTTTPGFFDRRSTGRFPDRSTARDDLGLITLGHSGSSPSTNSYLDRSTGRDYSGSRTTPGYVDSRATSRYTSRTSYDSPNWVSAQQQREIDMMHSPHPKELRDKYADLYQSLPRATHSNVENQYMGCTAKILATECHDKALNNLRFLAKNMDRSLMGKAIDCERASRNGLPFTGECKKVWELERDAYLDH